MQAASVPTCHPNVDFLLTSTGTKKKLGGSRIQISILSLDWNLVLSVLARSDLDYSMLYENGHSHFGIVGHFNCNGLTTALIKLHKNHT